MEGESAESGSGGGKASRSSRSKGKGKESATKRTPEGDQVIKAIMDTVTAQMARGEIDTNIFALPVSGFVSTSRVIAVSTPELILRGVLQGEMKETPGALRAHPRNMANREYQAATTDFINR
jgi:hypothetical protein